MSICVRLFLKNYSGTAGRQSSLVINGADFSTKDMDNDNCICKCALTLTGGKQLDSSETGQSVFLSVTKLHFSFKCKSAATASGRKANI